MTNKPYIVHLSNKVEIKIDSDELEKVMQGISTGSPVLLKHGLVNPSFVIAITADKERWNNIFDGLVGVFGSEEWTEKKRVISETGCKSLKSIFEGTTFLLNKSKINGLPETK